MHGLAARELEQPRRSPAEVDRRWPRLVQHVLVGLERSDELGYTVRVAKCLGTLLELLALEAGSGERGRAR